ncbi:Nucleoporin nup85 [Thoreauomyces humboldtii]|nr:Nucleoporin nup85 [Thoreauomyces humboldtii]
MQQQHQRGRDGSQQDEQHASSSEAAETFANLCHDNADLPRRQRILVGHLPALGNEVLVHLGPRVGHLTSPPTNPQEKLEEQQIAFVKFAADIPSSRVSFVHETHSVFAGLQAAVAAADGDSGSSRSLGADRRRSRFPLDAQSSVAAIGGASGTAVKRAVAAATVDYCEKILKQFQKVSREDPDISEITILSTAHSVMMLLEMVHIKGDLPLGPSQWDHVQEDYSAWLNTHYAAPADEDFLPFQNQRNPRDHPHYWDFVYQTLLRGHLMTVISILKRHPDYHAYAVNASAHATTSADAESPLVRLVELIQSRPTPAAHASQTTFEQQRARWLEQVTRGQTTLRRQVPGDVNDHEDIARVMAVLAGDERTIQNLALDWREAVSGLILFVHPSLKRHEIAELLSKARGTNHVTDNEDDESSIKELIEISVMEGNFQRTIRYCTKLDWWLVAHLADLLHHMGALDRDNLVASLLPAVGGTHGSGGNAGSQKPKPQREWYLLHYADVLLSHPDLWRVALEYVVACPVTGRDVLDQVVLRIPIRDDGEQKARKLVEFCKRHNLEPARRRLESVTARRKHREGRPGEAIEHYLAAKDVAMVAAVVDELVDRYLASGDLAWKDVAANLSSSSLEGNGRLTLLVRYREFHDLYARGSYEEAGALLVKIVGSSTGVDGGRNLLPKRLVYTALIDSLPLLSMEDRVVFGVQGTEELMWCLEEVTTSHRREEYLGAWEDAVASTASAKATGGSGGEPASVGSHRTRQERALGVEKAEAQLDLVREALVRNLSRAFMCRVK